MKPWLSFLLTLFYCINSNYGNYFCSSDASGTKKKNKRRKRKTLDKDKAGSGDSDSQATGSSHGYFDVFIPPINFETPPESSQSTVKDSQISKVLPSEKDAKVTSCLFCFNITLLCWDNSVMTNY